MAIQCLLSSETAAYQMQALTVSPWNGNASYVLH